MDSPTKRHRRFQPILLRIGAVLIGVLAALFLCEAALRVMFYAKFRSYMTSSPENPPNDIKKPVGFGQILYRTTNSLTLYRLKPNACGIMNRPLRINSIGFRDDEVRQPKPPKTFRILFLGDSTMFGWFIDRQNDYVEMIEDDLQAAAGKACRIECINTAVPSYNASQEVALFHESGLALQPDAVVIQYELNDDALFPYAIEPPFLFGSGLYLARLPGLWRNEFKTADSLVMSIQGKRLYEKYPQSHGWESVESAYRKLARTCRERGLPLMILMPPCWADADQPDRVDDKKFAQFRGLCRKLGIEPIEIFKTIQDYTTEHDLKYLDLVVSSTDNHANELGHALIAKAALPSIERVVLPRILGADHPLSQRPPDSNRALRYTTGHGFFTTEDWGEAVNWTKLKARTEFDPLGRRLNLTYRVSHPDASLTSPVTVTVAIRQANPPVERATDGIGQIETTRRRIQTATFTHATTGYFTQTIDLADFAPGRLELEIAVNRLFAPSRDRRHLGIGLYPLSFSP